MTLISMKYLGIKNKDEVLKTLFTNDWKHSILNEKDN